MACINRGKPVSPQIKFKAIQKIREQEYVSDQAHLIPENGGIAIYLSYELNKSLEEVFNTYSVSGFMGVSEFSRMCIDCNILPKNTNKDIICYIFKQPDSINTGYVDFKGFFQVLHRLSCYAFRKLIMTEQEKFNVLIKHLNAIKNDQVKSNHKFSIGVQVSLSQNTIGVNTCCEKTDVGCYASVEMHDKECLTDPVEFVKQETEKVEKLEDENILIETRKLKSKCTEDLEIRLKIEEMEKKCNDKEELNEKLKKEIDNALEIIKNKNIEIENLQSEGEKVLSTKNEEIEDLNNEIQKLEETKIELEKKKCELQKNLDVLQKENEEKDELKKNDVDFMNMKKTLILFGEEEGELFKIFFNYSTYDAEIAEYTMDKPKCAVFLASYYLLRKKEKNKKPINLTAKDAATLFKEAVTDMKTFEKKMPERSALNYFYFKLLLSKIGKFLYPDLSDRESFIEIVSKHIFFVHTHDKFLNKKGVNETRETSKMKMSKSSRLLTQNPSQIFDTFAEGMVGGYISSTEEEVFIQSTKQKERTGIRMIPTKKEDIINVNSDNTFEYIDSNKINYMKKLKSKENSTSNVSVLEKKVANTVINQNSTPLINNFLNKNIKNIKTYGYNTSSDDSSNSMAYLPSDYINIVSQRKTNLKNLRKNINTKGANRSNAIPPAEMKNNSKLIHLKKKPLYINDFNKHSVFKNGNIDENLINDTSFFHLEGTVWSPKATKKEYFLANFGNE